MPYVHPSSCRIPTITPVSHQTSPGPTGVWGVDLAPRDPRIPGPWFSTAFCFVTVPPGPGSQVTRAGSRALANPTCRRSGVHAWGAQIPHIHHVALGPLNSQPHSDLPGTHPHSPTQALGSPGRKWVLAPPRGHILKIPEHHNYTAPQRPYPSKATCVHAKPLLCMESGESPE